jgi:SAM-dependent methyltransferase
MTRRADDDASANRRYWDAYSDEYQARHGDQLRRPMVWGTWAVPEAEVGALGDVAGLDVLELGCGAAQWSYALADRGARPVGLDASGRQLDHARAASAGRRRRHRNRGEVPLVQASAVDVPLAAGSFDLVLSDHGALSYADPDDALPEVRRLLRPGGRLVLNTFTPFTSVCWDEATGRPDEALHRPYFDAARWDDVTGFVSYELGYADWIRVLRRHGFEIEDLHELRPGPRATSSHHTAADRGWARRWPGEHIWCARRAQPEA